MVTLNEILEQLSSYLENLDDTRRKVKSAMNYPIFMILFFDCYAYGDVTSHYSKIFSSIFSTRCWSSCSNKKND